MKIIKPILRFAFISILFFSCNNYKKKELVSHVDCYNSFKYVYINLENKYIGELSNLEVLNNNKPDSINEKEFALAIYFIKYSEQVKQNSKEIFKSNIQPAYCFKQQYELLINFRNVIKNVLNEISLYENSKKIKKRQDLTNLKKIYENALDIRFVDVFNSYLYRSSDFSYYDIQNKLLLDIQLIIDDYYNLFFWHLYAPQYIFN